MINRLAPYSFILVCFSLCFSQPDATMASETLKEDTSLQNHPSAMKEEDQWQIREYDYFYRHAKSFSKGIVVEPVEVSPKNDQNIFLRELCLGIVGEKNDHIFVCLMAYPNFKGFDKEKNKLTADLKSNKIPYYYFPCQFEGMYHEDRVTPAQFLSVFYKKDLIPDLIIDRVVKSMEIEDFRIVKSSLSDTVVRQMNAYSTANDFVRIALSELDKIKNPKQRAEETWELIQHLQTHDTFKPQITMDLCKQIKDLSLPFSDKAKALYAEMSAHEIASNRKIDRDERYKSAIITLLNVSHIPNDSSSFKVYLNNLVRCFMNQAQLDENLKDLKTTSDTIIILLQMIRQQKLKIDSLEKEIASKQKGSN